MVVKKQIRCHFFVIIKCLSHLLLCPVFLLSWLCLVSLLLLQDGSGARLWSKDGGTLYLHGDALGAGSSVCSPGSFWKMEVALVVVMLREPRSFFCPRLGLKHPETCSLRSCYCPMFQGTARYKANLPAQGHYLKREVASSLLWLRNDLGGG